MHVSRSRPPDKNKAKCQRGALSAMESALGQPENRDVFGVMLRSLLKLRSLFWSEAALIALKIRRTRLTFMFPGRDPSLFGDSAADSSAVALKGVTNDSAPAKYVGRPCITNRI